MLMKNLLSVRVIVILVVVCAGCACAIARFCTFGGKNAPAVVNISTASKVKPQRRADLNGIPEELLRRFFGDAFPIPPGQGEVPRGRGDDNKKRCSR